MSNVELKNKLLSLFYEGNSIFLKEDMDNIINGVSERSLCSSLAEKINRLIGDYGFGGYHADTEYNRNGGEIKTIIGGNARIISITCDLIVHSRGNKEKDNLIALEMKKLPCGDQELNSDRERLAALTKHRLGDTFSYNGFSFPKRVCDYEVGIFYMIDIHRETITLEIYDNGQLVNVEEESFDYFKGFSRPAAI